MSDLEMRSPLARQSLIIMMNNTSLEYEESFFEEYDKSHAQELFLSKVFVVTCTSYVYIFCCGVPANAWVMKRLWRFAKENREKYKNGTGLGLFVMATSDLITLLVILLQYIRASLTTSVSDLVNSLTCKALIFVAHMMTSVSIWSWLLMSTLRYVAIRHPLAHLRLWRAPYRAIALIVFLSALTHIWLLFAVSNGTTGCSEHPFYVSGVSWYNANRWFYLIECIWSYCLPVGAILYMDTMVFLCCPRRSKRVMAIGRRNRCSAVCGNTIKSNSNKKANKGLWKWLIIAFIDVVLNTPENLYRLLNLLDIQAISPNDYNSAFRMISQALYFSQFAFNAVYLSLFVFDKGIRPDAPHLSSQSIALNEARLSIIQL